MQIKPNELRIGNILQDREGRICSVEEIYKDEFRAPAVKGAITSHPITPIELSEEWLVKLGFEPCIDWFICKVDNITFHLYKWHDKNQFYFQAGSGRIPINSVHKLQNIFFELTDGKELTIKF